MIVVLLPVIVALGFNIALYQLVSRAEAMAAIERQQSEIVDHINTVTIIFANAGGSIASYAVTGSVRYLNSGKEYVEQFRREIAVLDKLTANDAEGRAAIDQFKKLAEAEFSQLTEIGPPVSGASYDMAVENIRGLRSMIKQAGIKSQIVMRVSNAQKLRLDKMRAQEEASRRQVKEIIFWGNIANIIFAALLITLFIRHITARLALLVQNAGLLPTGRPLLHHVDGGDEFAYLDDVLHDASKQLKRAADNREQVMQMVAHDLRSPLMSSQISLEILTSDKMPEPAPQAKKHIFAVKHNVALLVGLVNDLLTIDKLEAGKLEIASADFAIAKLVDDTIQTVAGLALRKEISILNRCSSIYAFADRDRINQVLTNYLSNAIKFSPKQSQIVVSDLVDVQNRGQVKIVVQDQGPGVARNQRAKLFQRFYQLDGEQKSQGFGLGLAICKLIIETHGGQVGVDSADSEAGQGSRFWFTLPVGEGPQARPSER